MIGLYVLAYIIPAFILFCIIFRHTEQVVPGYVKLVPWLVFIPLLLTWVPISTGIWEHISSAHEEGDPGIFFSSYYGACSSPVGWLWTSPSFTFATTTYIVFVLTDKSNITRSMRAAHLLVMFFIALSVSWPLYLLASAYSEPFPEHKISNSQRYVITQTRTRVAWLLALLVLVDSVCIRVMHSYLSDSTVVMLALAAVHVLPLVLMVHVFRPQLLLTPVSTMLSPTQRRRLYALIATLALGFHLWAWYQAYPNLPGLELSDLLSSPSAGVVKLYEQVLSTMGDNLWQLSVSYDLLFTTLASVVYIWSTTKTEAKLKTCLYLLLIPFLSISVIFPLFLAMRDSDPAIAEVKRERKRLKICVVGAGIGGLSAAYLLGQEHEVCVCLFSLSLSLSLSLSVSNHPDNPDNPDNSDVYR